MEDKINGLLFDVIDEVNEQLDDSRKITRSTETVLFGEGGTLDSLGLVNFIVETEQRIHETFGVSVALADERAMSQRSSPFRSIQSLADYIASLLKESAHA
jgi:D-alanine--poly(phosphoribitol) ligase subunit 2